MLLIQTHRTAHQHALNLLNKIEIYTNELSSARREHKLTPSAQTTWKVSYYEKKKTDAIESYARSLQSIIDPIITI